ncbi:MAG TPA: zf-HC2 domain-containing protein [Ktedonobacteraceae bacterium]
MRCTKAIQQLQLYIDHQLTLRQTRVLEAHVSSCSACREELHFLETVSCGLNALKIVPEPTDMHEQIMQKVARTTARKQQLLREKQATGFKLFRPSLGEILAAVLLATVATLITLLQQPFMQNLLPITKNHDPYSVFYMHIVYMLKSIDTNTLGLALWIVGTLLGVVITLMVAGSEMRTQWFKAMMERKPVR